jgi:signal transduction histidine kinase
VQPRAQGFQLLVGASGRRWIRRLLDHEAPRGSDCMECANSELDRPADSQRHALRTVFQLDMLHELLTALHEEVIQRWKERVESMLLPSPMSPLELVDEMPEFLGEVVRLLRTDAGLEPRDAASARTEIAASHGEQRLRLGFSLSSVVQEYGALQDAIVETAQAHGQEVTLREVQLIYDSILHGIVHAVSQYIRQRDAEFFQRANQSLAFMSHELRNAISSASSTVEILKQQAQIPPDSYAFRALEGSIGRTISLLDQMLRTAKVTAGVGLRRHWTRLVQLFDEATMSAMAEAELKHVELRQEIASDQELFLDPSLMQSALDNLVRNAVKFSRPGGGVTLRGRVENSHATIEIEDCCGGLDPGDVEEAFTPFVRLDEEQAGFGLGLAIARQAVSAHGGTLRVQNLPGKGCVFALELPIGEPGAPRA